MSDKAYIISDTEQKHDEIFHKILKDLQENEYIQQQFPTQFIMKPMQFSIPFEQRIEIIENIYKECGQNYSDEQIITALMSIDNDHGNKTVKEMTKEAISLLSGYVPYSNTQIISFMYHVLQDYCERKGILPNSALKNFIDCGVLSYLRNNYEILHRYNKDIVFEKVDKIIKQRRRILE